MVPQNYGFVSEDKLPWLFLSFFFLKSLPFFLLPAAGFTIVTRHQSDVMVPPESQSLPPVNVWTAASSPSSLCYRPPDITERHLSRACRGKYLTLWMFRDITSPSRSAYQRILILLMNSSSRSNTFSKLIWFRFVYLASSALPKIFFSPHNCHFLERKVPHFESFESFRWVFGSLCLSVYDVRDLFSCIYLC